MEDGNGEVDAASLVGIADDSLLVGKTITGGRPAVEPEPLVAVLSAVGSKMMVLEITTVVTLPSSRVVAERALEDSVASGSMTGVEATLDVGEGDAVVVAAVEDGLAEGL